MGVLCDDDEDDDHGGSARVLNVICSLFVAGW